MGEVEESGLGEVGNGVESDLAAPLDEVGEMNVGGEVLVAGVLVSFGRKEAEVVGVGTEGAEGTAVENFGRIASVINGEHGAEFEVGQVLLKPLVDRFGHFKTWRRGLEEKGVGLIGEGLPKFAEMGVEVEFFPAVVEDPDGEGIEEFVREDEGFSFGGLEGLAEGRMPRSFSPFFSA